MSSTPVSRPFCHRLAFTLSAVIASSVITGPAARAADGRISHSSAPAWGTDHTSVLTLTAADFESDDAQVSFFTGAGFRTCLTPPSGGLCTFKAGVPLPSGSLIEYIEFAVCDNHPTEGATASLYAWEEFEDGPAVASIATQGDNDCSLWTSGYVGVTVDNLSRIYIVAVDMPPAAALRFRAVRIFYSLQVSPAPGFATFNDVPTNHPLFQYVEALYASGITAGCGGGNFCPGAPLTRGQMAVFLAKALGLYFPN
jgi:S-layer homology domain